MPQIINTNIASLNAQRNLESSQNAQSQALQRLSSGLRINGAKDDAAGLAISNRIDAQVRGLNVANRNAGDGVSLAQTAEGALNSITTSLQRVRELALQSANGSNTDLERSSLQEEVEQLKAEIQSISEKTNFNGQSLLDGSFQDTGFQTGANVGDRIDVSINETTVDTLGAAATAGVTSNNSKTALTAEQTIAAGDLTINGAAISAPVGSNDDTSFALQGSSAISKAAAINAETDLTGVTATANPNTVEGTTIAAGVIGTGVVAETVAINGVDIELQLAEVEAETALTAVADTINTKSDLTGVTASVVETSTGFRVDLTSEDGRNITVDTTTGGAEDFGLVDDGTDGTAVTFIGDVTLTSDDGSDINVGSNTQNIDNFGFEKGTYSGNKAALVGDNGNDGTRAALQAGDLTLNNVSVGATKAGDDTASSTLSSSSGIALAAAINRVSDQSGVSATVNENRVYSGAVTVTGTDFDISINGTQITGAMGADLATNLTTTIDAINAKSGLTGVTAEALDNNQYTLVAEDGRNIELTVATAGDSGFTADENYVAGVTLEAAGEFSVGTLTGNNERAGFNAVGSFGGSESGTLLKDVDISTLEGAEEAITAIDNAINQVASEQAKLGAIQNRFESTISNNSVSSENLSAANSRIRDADFAAETAALSKSQVLQQAGISVLSQANARPQQVLSLLQ
jgi:flagellin